MKILLFALLTIMIVGSVDAMYTPCSTCYVNTTPVITYEPVIVAFDVTPSYARVGQSVTVSGYQVSGTPLSLFTTWQFVAQSGSDAQVINGQTGSFTPKKSRAKYSIYLTARDPLQMLNGYIRYPNIVTTR